MRSSVKFSLLLLVGLLCVLLQACGAQQLTSSDFTAENTFTDGVEGPAVDMEGNLYAVSLKRKGDIGIVDKNGNAKVFVELPEKSIGNGIRFDKEGHMYIADYTGHNVLQVKKGSKEVLVFAHNSNMSQPNDLTISPNGTIYLSDPNWAKATGRVWMVNASQEIILLEDNMGTTNGIEASPDGKYLYVNESVQRKVWRFAILPDGTLAQKTEFITFDDFGMDGMRCDEKGNLYITRYDKGTVIVLSPDGKKLSEIVLKGKKPSNITFGGADGKTCYVTMADRGCIETFRAKYNGVNFKN